MNYLNVKMLKTSAEYDWDNIDVGNNNLNHSENFFSEKHFEHEKLDEMEFLQQAIVKTELNASLDNNECNNDENKENLISSSPVDVRIEENYSSPSLGKKCQKNKEKLTSPVAVKKELEEKEQEIGKSPNKIVRAPQSQESKNTKSNVNLANQWSIKKTISSASSKGAVCKVMPPPPQAYLIKDIYRRNREEAERCRAEEDRKKREFHSRPVPKFTAYHEQLQKHKPVHLVTLPVTPKVLKNSREADEKRRKKLDEWNLKNQPQKFEPRPLTILKEKPFIPKKKSHVIQQCPFNLNSEKRLQERKQFDELKQKAMEEKQKQVEIEETERKKREEEHIKELRKAATFKARPNPFKK